MRVSQQIIEGIINAIPVRVFWKDKDLVFLGCNEAFALDAGYPDLPKIIEIKEIGDPQTIPWPASFITPDPSKPWTRNETCPAMNPFEIYKDHLVKVSATLVDHYQVYPSFAFRFDTNDGSVVISGDTGPNTKGNLQKLAKGTNVLVHEVIDNLWIDTALK